MWSFVVVHSIVKGITLNSTIWDFHLMKKLKNQIKGGSLLTTQCMIIGQAKTFL